jgi:hypothetical protein
MPGGADASARATSAEPGTAEPADTHSDAHSTRAAADPTGVAGATAVASRTAAIAAASSSSATTTAAVATAPTAPTAVGVSVVWLDLQGKGINRDWAETDRQCQCTSR